MRKRHNSGPLIPVGFTYWGECGYKRRWGAAAQGKSSKGMEQGELVRQGGGFLSYGINSGHRGYVLRKKESGKSHTWQREVVRFQLCLGESKARTREGERCINLTFLGNGRKKRNNGVWADTSGKTWSRSKGIFDRRKRGRRAGEVGT